MTTTDSGSRAKTQHNCLKRADGEQEDRGTLTEKDAIAAGHAHFVRSWVPKDRHPVGAAEGCGPRVRALGLRGAGTLNSK